MRCYAKLRVPYGQCKHDTQLCDLSWVKNTIIEVNSYIVRHKPQCLLKGGVYGCSYIVVYPEAIIQGWLLYYYKTMAVN